MHLLVGYVSTIIGYKSRSENDCWFI